jgi:hypothetical protein
MQNYLCSLLLVTVKGRPGRAKYECQRFSNRELQCTWVRQCHRRRNLGFITGPHALIITQLHQGTTTFVTRSLGPDPCCGSQSQIASHSACVTFAHSYSISVTHPKTYSQRFQSFLKSVFV